MEAVVIQVDKTDSFEGSEVDEPTYFFDFFLEADRLDLDAFLTAWLAIVSKAAWRAVGSSRGPVVCCRSERRD